MASIKWGIVSCGKICQDFALALYRLNSPQHQLFAVASRNCLESARHFAKKYNIKKSYGSYAELFADPEIDAVYIGNLNTAHMPACIEAIQAGKAVLCEKPLTMSEYDSQQVIDSARIHEVLLMEGLWTRFNPVYTRIWDLMTGPGALEPVGLTANFTVNLLQADRATKPELGGSAMLDIGIYGVQLAQKLFGNAPSVDAHGSVNDLGVDMSANITLRYADNTKVANLFIDGRFGHPEICEARIFFAPGSEYSSVKVGSPFWAPNKLELTKWDGSVIVEDHPLCPQANTDDGLAFNYLNSQALAYEAEAFMHAFTKWKKTRGTNEVCIEHHMIPHEDTLANARMIEQIVQCVKAENEN